MDFSQIFSAILAFIFVLGLMFITLWLIKYCQQKGLNCKLNHCFNNNKRLKIIEHHRIDIKTSVVLLQYDKYEFLLLLGASSNTILHQSPMSKKD